MESELRAKLAESLYKAWHRHLDLFGEEPHGTMKQWTALLELVPDESLAELASHDELVAAILAKHTPMVCYLKASNGERRWIACSCGENTEVVAPGESWWNGHFRALLAASATPKEGK